MWTGSTLVQVMACRLVGAMPLPKTMLAYCQWDSWEQISVKLVSELYHFHKKKNAFGNVACQYGGHLSKGRWVNHMDSLVYAIYKTNPITSVWIDLIKRGLFKKFGSSIQPALLKAYSHYSHNLISNLGLPSRQRKSFTFLIDITSIKATISKPNVLQPYSSIQCFRTKIHMVMYIYTFHYDCYINQYSFNSRASKQPMANKFIYIFDKNIQQI